MTSDFRRAFTLTEILIVIALIVLMLALAVPAFNLISGGKSIEGASNQLSAALGRARAEAIGLQKKTGVLFFTNPRNNRRTLAIVQETSAPTPNGGIVNIWLDLVDADFLPLPAGVGAQFVNDCTFNASNQRTSDGYLGFNFTAIDVDNGSIARNTETAYGGVILFDGNGNLTSQTYGFRCMTPGNDAYQWTALGKLLYPQQSAQFPTLGSPRDMIPGSPSMPAAMHVRSQFGLVMFPQDDFENNSGKDDDAPLMNNTAYGNSTTAGTEAAEEAWLDANSTPLMINRYNGTLVKGE